jgi:hypothetical protein
MAFRIVIGIILKRRRVAQRLVLAAAAGQARRLRLKPTSLARGAYPQAAKPLSAANGVGRSPLLEQDTHARKRLFLDWQGADDTATRHDFYSTTPGKAQQPEHLLTFTSLCRQGHDQAGRLRLQHSPPQSQGHAQERTSCADPPPLPAQPFSPACATPGEPAFGSALRQRAGAGGHCQAKHPDRNVHRPKVTCAGNIPRQATCPSSQALSFSMFIPSAPNGPRFSRREASAASEACRLDARVSQRSAYKLHDDA